ncbi:MAG: tetratricopeptide repeat-containing sensor histidine kinase [Bacteroidia bacterium]|nr:tetratricopeptide repeat-containing sensor histidine kinase [Bacteroidia bacterium]
MNTKTKIHLISFILCIIFCLLYLNAIAQRQTKLDSLLNELKTAKDDTTTVNILNDIAWEYMYFNTDSALHYANRGYELTRKIKFNKRIATCLITIGSVFLIKGEYQNAEETYLKALQKYLSDHDTLGIAECYSKLGIVMRATGNYTRGIDYFNKSIVLYKDICDSVELASTYNSIGSLYFYKGDFQKAIEFYQKSVRIKEKFGDREGVSCAYYNIGNVLKDIGNYASARKYLNDALTIDKDLGDIKGIANCNNMLGIISRKEGNYDEALKFYTAALESYDKIGMKIEKAGTLMNIGIVYQFKKEYLQSTLSLEKALKELSAIGDKKTTSMCLTNLSSNYVNLGQLQKATSAAEQALQLALEISSLSEIADAYSALSEIARQKGSFQDAYKYYVLFNRFCDSLLNESTNRQITEMQTKYETEKKEKEITLLNKEKELQKVEIAKKDAEVKKKNLQRNAFIGGFILVGLLALVIFRGYKQKLKSNKILNEKNILITEQKEELEQTLEELKTTQEQLIESEKMASLGNLVAGVAHEINTPVGIGITASSSLVEQTKQFAALYKSEQMSRRQLEEYLENIYQTGNLILKNMTRTGELVRSFKQVSIDQITEDKRKFLLKSYIEDILLSLKPELGNKQITTTIDCAPNLEIDSYPGIFAQIITNLVLNSIRHGFHDIDSGCITIIVQTHSGASLYLQYIDTGCGIPPEILPKIFDPFFTTNKQKGTGLGLNIVYNLVIQKLKGTIRCESTTGKGVKFILEIP